LRILPWVNLVRPSQQVKGGAVLLGALASGNINSTRTSINVFLLICAWVALSGFVYIVNDITDLETDRNHAEKSKRPVASGQISVINAALSAALLLVFSGFLLMQLEMSLVWIGLVYLLINIAYSLYLKNTVIIDLIIVSSGFVLRGLSGVLVVNATPSVWFILLSVFGSLLLVAGKRAAQKEEISVIKKSHRESISRYSTSFLKQIQIMSGTGLIFSYVLMSQEKFLATELNRIILNLSILPFLSTVLYIIYYLDQEKETDVTRLLVSQKALTISCAIWTLTFTLAMVL
jgi:decaprenyl-phosphate phosphoribosyltransferase